MKIAFALCLSLVVSPAVFAQQMSQAPVTPERIAATVMSVYPNGRGDDWNYDEGTMLVFPDARYALMKRISTLGTTAPAKPLLTDQGDTLMAIAHVGKGRVFAVGDPWVYNEYTDGRKLPTKYENYQAAKDLVAWSVGAGKAR